MGEQRVDFLGHGARAQERGLVGKIAGLDRGGIVDEGSLSGELVGGGGRGYRCHVCDCGSR